MASLSNAQLEIIKMFDKNQSEQELFELKQVLSEYFANKLVKEIERESVEKGYTKEVANTWKDEHYRTANKANGITHEEVIKQLEALLDEYTGLLINIPERDFSFKPSAIKWSKKEILGHLVDSAQNNIQRF